jgi:DNA-binding HxlR family transcriptional regulator
MARYGPPRPRPGSATPARALLEDGHLANVYSRRCPSRDVLDRIADRWTALTLGALGRGPQRFGQLREQLDGISEKMLTQTLRAMERDGLIVRDPQPTFPPTVEYSLTDLGTSLEVPLAAVRAWAEAHIDDVDAARTVYDTDHDPAGLTA